MQLCTVEHYGVIRKRLNESEERINDAQFTMKCEKYNFGKTLAAAVAAR